ncbi:unnamed protein product [Kuraishia capsulata CBS 1993]|uniref:Pseudouridine synthase I TruA alpha/beta domain-containing protein n=1 Tax=Kuraishia capsulata CBS 1993 TaxID=1382522 RepID=W6MRW1_9ASCO|nr:uncharacterized protein KUCA_T00003962001 [Kuraishia capsulata CBS 1993]CDK27982.1 unnamed protein product [Kuraishia capsulata CBS 1993]
MSDAHRRSCAQRQYFPCHKCMLTTEKFGATKNLQSHGGKLMFGYFNVGTGLIMARKRLFSVMSVQSKGPTEPSKVPDYTNWTKKQLLKKILELEGREDEIEETPLQVVRPPKESTELDFSKYHSRKIALRFSYLGWNYQGLAVQREATTLPTVEFEILKALHRTKMIKSLTPSDCDFSRCGRTDKGVSAMNQVISLRVRSKLDPEEQKDPLNDPKELDYVNILNKIVPDDIKFHAICLRPPEGFDARFSCIGRHYKYIFEGEGLDIELMRKAAKKFEGVHDFRNFCKVDGAKQITNFVRNVFSAEILELKGHDNLYVFDLKGKAFLWHQVRCMMAILFQVGQKLENDSIIDYLLDIEKCPRKPLYNMAHDIPLVLYDCTFPEMEWIDSAEGIKGMRSSSRLKALNHDYRLKNLISDFQTEISIKHSLSVSPGIVCENVGDGLGAFLRKYTPMKDRSTSKSPEELNEAWRLKKGDKEDSDE